MNTKNLTAITLWANRITAAVVLSLVFTLPSLLEWYADLLGYHPPQRDMIAIAVVFDLCAAAIFFALYNMERLLGNIRRRRVFERENVHRVRRVAWSCAVVAAICVVATWFALPMIIFSAIMAFLCLTVNVVGCVMDAAVALREENDLTI